jgi:anti-anti-sigma regulatory factor
VAVKVTLSGTQTIREAAETVETLRSAVAKNDDVSLDCSGITDADLTFIQMVMAARKSVAAKGKTLSLAAAAQGPLLAALDAAGIKAAGTQQFWFEGAR